MSSPVATIPWIPGALRRPLLDDPTFFAACGGRLSTILPSEVTFCAQLRVAGNNSLDGTGVAWSPLVQLDGWCAPDLDGIDPEMKAWDIAAAGAAVLGRVRNLIYQTMSYSVRRIVEGPLPDVDLSRGESTPLYRAIVRAELVAHVTAIP